MDQQAARRHLAQVSRQKAAIEPRWRRAVMAALAAGMTMAETGRVAGVSRQRIFEIRTETGRVAGVSRQRIFEIRTEESSRLDAVGGSSD
jgi:hypothetical protein